jgi:predicted transcriptional regulator
MTGIISGMAMTLRLTDADTEALKRQAEREGVSMQTVAQNAIRSYLTERDLAADVDQALDVLTPRYQNLLDRLGTV